MTKGGSLFIFAILLRILNACNLLFLYTKRADSYKKNVRIDKITAGTVHRIDIDQARPQSTISFANKPAKKGAISKKDNSK